MKYFIHINLILVLLIPQLRAQQGEGPLDRYIQEGIESNLQLKNKQLEVNRSLALLKEAKGMFYPRLSFEASYTLAGGGRAIAFPVGDLLNPVYSTLNAMTGENKFPQIENVNEQFLPNNFHETKLRLIQPVFNQQLNINKRIQETSTQLAENETEVYRRELVKEIRTAYFQYLQTLEALDIYDTSDTLLKEILRVNTRLAEQDKVTYDAVYQAEYQRSANEQARADMEAKKRTAQAYFNFLLNKEANAAVEIDSSLAVRFDPSSPEALQEQAVQSRSEMQSLYKAKALNSLQHDIYKSEALPSLNAVVDLGYQGFGYTFDQDQDFWLGQLSLSWNLFQGFQRKARMEQSQIQANIIDNQQQALSRQFGLQVQQAWYELDAAWKSLASSRSGLRAASASFRIIDRKYRANQASWLDWNQARTALNTAKLSLNQAQYGFLSKQAQLDWAAGKY